MQVECRYLSRYTYIQVDVFDTKDPNLKFPDEATMYEGLDSISSGQGQNICILLQ